MTKGVGGIGAEGVDAEGTAASNFHPIAETVSTELFATALNSLCVFQLSQADCAVHSLVLMTNYIVNSNSLSNPRENYHAN